MTDSWDERRKAAEESFFEKREREALARFKARQGGEARRSPITGEAMEQVQILGVNVDRCPTSGGIWLDKGELEEILKASQGGQHSWIGDFLTRLITNK